VRELIRKVIKEALGVPDNIVNVANQIFDNIINSVKDKTTVEELDGKPFVFKGDYRIADFNFKKVEFVFEFMTDYDNNNIEILGMATRASSKITKKFKIKTILDKNKFTLKFTIVAPDNTTGKEIKDYMIKEKVEFISSISHELKHRYDDFKKQKSSLTRRAEYMAVNKSRFGDVTPINDFLFNLYFVHSIENLVRPSELAGAINAGDVTKKGFYEFLTNYRVYKKLKEIQGFTYEGFRESLKQYIPQIKDLFDDNNINYTGMTEDEFIDKTLEIVLVNLMNWRAKSTYQLLASHPLELFTGKKDKFFNKYLEKLSRFNDDFKKYFEYEEKMFRFVATKMIKKISKLYDMAKNQTNESIINWELWHKLKGNDNKIVTEFKYLKESTDYILPTKHPMVQGIIKLVGSNSEFTDFYTQPYADNEESVDYVIKYNIDKISLWKEDSDYVGTIRLNIEGIFVGDSDSNKFERMYYRDDLPELCWENFEDSILNEIEKFMPNISVDITLKFPGPKN